LGIDLGRYSPAVQEQVIYAATHNPSFAQGSDALRHLAELDIPTKQVERLARRIGDERCAERDSEVQTYLNLPLVERKAAPAGVEKPGLAVVQMDGGRLQVLDRIKTATRAKSSEDASTSHWREDKVGLLATMTSEPGSTDPCPTIPEHFVDSQRILKLAREIKGSVGLTEEDVPSPDETAAAKTPSAYSAPDLEKRTVIATLANAHEFGGILAQAAWNRGFYEAERRAFVADGSSANWGVWERHFSNFTPIVDFIHGLTYVFSAAMAGRSFSLGWAAYTEWIGHVWAGQIELVIDALSQRQLEMGQATDDEAETSPRNKVAEALGYLRNQKERMQYAEYRKQGLPITSSHIESTIKRINQRVKGSEKFWSEEGAEAMLQLRADTLSETDPLAGFWERRQAAASGQRCYSSTA
jgi:hypothetical protein